MPNIFCSSASSSRLPTNEDCGGIIVVSLIEWIVLTKQDKEIRTPCLLFHFIFHFFFCLLTTTSPFDDTSFFFLFKEQQIQIQQARKKW